MEDMGSEFVLGIPSGRVYCYYEAAGSLIRAYQRSSGLRGALVSGPLIESDWDQMQHALEVLASRSYI